MSDDGNSSFFARLTSKLKNFAKMKTIVVVVLIFVILLIFASSFKTKGKSNSNQPVENSFESFRSMEYCDIIENKLENVLANVKGVGNVKAFVMVDSSPTFKYLEEVNSSTTGSGDNLTSSNQTTVYEAKNGSIYSPVVVVEILPKIIGVLIVATGAKDIQMKATLINIVASVLNVNVSCVEVLEGK